MRCHAWVLTEQRKRKGSGTPYEHVKAVADAYERETPRVIKFPSQKREEPRRLIMHPIPPDNHPTATRCGGEIVAKVAAVDEPDWGGTYAQLNIEITCIRCGWTYHGVRMPTTAEELSRVLTEWIAGLPDA